MQWLKNLLRQIVPLNSSNWVEREAHRLLSRAIVPGTTIEEKVDLLLANPAFFALQQRSEILGLLRRVEAIRPRVLCEIGSQQGGTLFLLSQVIPQGARILSLDIEHTPACRIIADRIRSVQPGTPVTCITADSHATDTRDQVRDWLQGELFDFLFIDGDHSYAGVKQDYEMYTPFVRDGGLFAFHDINPLQTDQPSEPNGADPGDVPRFWAEIKSTFTETEEFVDDPTRSGYGIAVVTRRV